MLYRLSIANEQLLGRKNLSPENNRGFDAEAFYKALKTTVELRPTTWKQVSAETGVSVTTLSRMSDGRQPDAGSLAALAAWAGLNISDFVSGISKPAPEPMAMVRKLLKEDTSLSPESAEALGAILQTAYENFKRIGAANAAAPAKK